MNDYLLYEAQVTLLTPVFIGSGQTMLYEYDFAIHDRRTWRLNETALLELYDVDDPAVVEQLMQRPPAELIQDPALYKEGSDLFRYVIRGTPRSKQSGAQVNEQLKDAYDRPYLPGSSLKGALRTALAWKGWDALNLRPERSRLKPGRTFAAQNYERAIFGRDPNHDLLRALQVGDSAPVAADRLMIANARVLHRSGKLASPIELEALKPDTVFTLPIKIDLALFSDWAGADRLHPRAALEELPQYVQSHTAQRLETETQWFADVQNAGPIANFYRQLPRSGLGDNIFLLQLGWGTGWDDKTFGSHLRENTQFLEGILSSRREGGYGIARGKRRPGEPFPKSRRVLVEVRSNRQGGVVERPRSPLGWVLVELNPQTRGEIHA